MEVRTIKIRLIGKQELFKVIALGEALRMPVLFVGEPGVAKTQTLLDYGHAMLVKAGIDAKEIAKQCFIIELDEGTKSAEVKGRPNMKELLENKTFKMDTPIADALFVMINEVDKGTSGVRNTLLSVMREKKLFLGGEVKNCNWKVFVGSCNTITTDEENIPFWDRFLIKQKVERVKPELFAQIWKENEEVFDINIPTTEEIKNCQVSLGKMSSFISLIHQNVTDRTITATLPLVKAIKLIWGLGDKEAIVKACSFVAPEQTANVSKNIEDPFIKELKGKIIQISKHTDVNYIMDSISEIDEAFLAMAQDVSNTTELEEMKRLLKKEVNNNASYKSFMAAQKKAKDMAKASLSKTVGAESKALAQAEPEENPF